MAKLILTRGVPASGKSTWAKNWVAEDPKNRLRVNRDNIRWTLGIKTGVGDYEQEKEVSHWEREMVRRGLQTGKDVVVDATNLRAKYVKEWMWLASDENVEVEFKDFPISYVEARLRDAIREGEGERAVGVEVTKMFFDKFVDKHGNLPPVPSIEGLALPAGNYAKYVERNDLPYAIIVDIDGTLAHMNGRSPYDGTRYLEDHFDHTIALLSQSYAQLHGRKLILLSGRNETGRGDTVRWLFKHGFQYDALYMRAADDNRNDAIVKDELFEQHIAGRYNVDFILDDRDRVVKMWREKGLKVLQVADGNF